MLKNGKYPIGFWNYTNIDNPKARNVQDWVDAGMTVAHTPSCVAGEGNKAHMLAVLDEAGRNDIACIVCDERLHAAYHETETRKSYQAVADDFARHPAVIGLHVGDEPIAQGDVEANDSRLVKRYRLAKEVAPHLKPFLNLHPWSVDSSTSGLMGRPGMKYIDVLDEYVRETGMDYLCYDCYSQMNAGDSGFNQYFHGLEVYRAAAEHNGIPFWTTLLCVGHFRYRCPNEDDLRWQLHTAAAHGAQGILWFFFYMRMPHCNFRLSPIDEHWERTETFTWLSRVNRTFQRIYGSLLMKMKLEAVWHVNRTYGGVPLFEDGCDPLVVCTHIPPECGAILSRFRHEDGSLYYALTNNSTTESIRGNSIRFRAEGLALHEVLWNGVSPTSSGTVEEFHGPLDMYRGVKCILTGDSLAPGQMTMWKVAKR